ncbi:beta strand repeat-containing protein [Secundilactobacillus paracollinoides]|nr:MucBP domain-containing protein [Secundilactobacillus paracollinoides]
MMKVTGEKHDHQFSKWLTLGVASSVLFLASQTTQLAPAKTVHADNASSSSEIAAAQDTMPVAGSSFSKSGDTFTSTTNQWKLVGSTSDYTMFATNVTTVGGHTVYSADSQFVLLFNSDQDLSKGTYVINGRKIDGDGYDGGSFRSLTIDGQTYYGIYLDGAMVDDVLKRNIQGQLSSLQIKNGPTGVSSSIALDFYERLTVHLPVISGITDQNSVAAALKGQTANAYVSDDLGDSNIFNINLISSDIEATPTSSTGSYTLNDSGEQRIAAQLTLQDILNASTSFNVIQPGPSSSSSSTSSSSSSSSTKPSDGTGSDGNDTGTTGTDSTSSTSSSTTDNSGTKTSSDSSTDSSTDSNGGSDTDSTGADNSSSTSTTPISNTINYVNEYGSKVGSTTISGVQDVADTLDVSATLPQGYVLADGQDAKVQYTFTPDGTLTVQVKKAPAILVSGTVTYVDQDGNTVGTPKTMTVTANSMHIYTAVVPAGYELASGQRASVPYLWTNADSTKNNLTIHLVKLSAQDYGTVTVNYVDADTGKILDTETFTGVVGDRVPFDTTTVVSGFLKDGYLVQNNETLGAAWYTTAGQTLTVTLKKQAGTGGNTGDNGSTGNDTGDNGSTGTGNNSGDNGSTGTGNNTGDNGSTGTGNNTGDNGSTGTGNNTGDNGSTGSGNNTGDNGSTGNNTGDSSSTGTGNNTGDNSSTGTGSDTNGSGDSDSNASGANGTTGTGSNGATDTTGNNDTKGTGSKENGTASGTKKTDAGAKSNSGDNSNSSKTPKLATRVKLPSTMKQPGSSNSNTTAASTNNGENTTPMATDTPNTSSTAANDADLPTASAAFVTLADNEPSPNTDATTPSTADATPQTAAQAQNNTPSNDSTSAQQAAAQKAAEAAATQQRQITAAKKAAAARRASHERVQREALKQLEDANQRDQFAHQSVAFSGSGHGHQHGDGGPAGGGDAVTELGKYFSVLSGKINFGR